MTGTARQYCLWRALPAVDHIQPDGRSHTRLRTVFKIAGAEAEAGLGLDEVERPAIKTNYRTRSLGVAFDGCTLPGAEEPLFHVPAGKMALGLGIHGEPGISDHDMPTASELAQLLVSQLGAQVEAMRSARDSGNAASFVEADLAFHDGILQASGNVFIAVLFEPLHRVLESRREETSPVPEIQSNTIEMHEEILRSLELRDPERSRVAMDNHMTQTLRDLQHYVLNAP